jgi:hypothetical protein
MGEPDTGEYVPVGEGTLVHRQYDTVQEIEGEEGALVHRAGSCGTERV